MNIIENIKARYKKTPSGSEFLTAVSEKAYDAFNRVGIPTAKNEEWKYTRIGSVFNKEYQLGAGVFTFEDFKTIHLPGHENANALVFVNGIYSSELSVIRSASLIVQSLEVAAEGEFAAIVSKNLGHSNKYIKDGIHALNTAFVKDGVFIHVQKGKTIDHPIYIYHITDARQANVLSQPRTLVYVAENAQVKFVETYSTVGSSDSFINQVMEIALERDAVVEYYKIQNDVNAVQVSTTNFRQLGRSFVHAVTVSLDGKLIRNNLNMALEADHSEAHLYGLYFLKGQTHVDNHTIVDNVKPHCLSNELYKGIIGDKATAVFNGKIFVEQDAQKINAFQSNKNILLSDEASVNTKPQLEIFADDVKCSHGCTVGQLDEEGLFYLQSRGIDKEMARSLLIHGFVVDILEYIKIEPIRKYVDQLIAQRLEFELE